MTAQAPAPLALVLFQNGRLTITATNADLAGILHTVSVKGGLRVEGPIPAQHVFGVYGPGEPREVLSQLLAGFGYNYMLVGTGPQGMPRQLVLSMPGGGAPAFDSADSTPANADAPSSLARDSAEAPPQEAAEASQEPTPGAGSGENGEPLGPGAIANVPPNETEDAQDASNAGVRAQQNMERLQKMQEAQSEQQSTPQ